MKFQQFLTRHRNRIAAALLLLSAGMMAYGIWRGEMAIVLGKAIIICLECIGLG